MSIVTCKECDFKFEADPTESADNRRPCPQCGSKARAHFYSGSAVIKAGGSVEITDGRENVSLPNLLLQTLVIKGEKTEEGRLIKAVTLPWIEIVKILEKDPKAAYEIPPHVWEEIIAGAYDRAGFDKVILTPRSGDLGRDIIAEKVGIGQIRVVDQVKAYKPDHLVKANDVRALMGILQGDSASKGFVTTTSDFAPKIAEDPLITPFIPSKIELINGERLREMLIKAAGID